ncbi:MAG: GTPase [Bdellovibrionales bacterium]
MRLKSFHGATHSEAMRLVREALGEDAIIVATRDDENGGVRVTAAIDELQMMSVGKMPPPANRHNPSAAPQSSSSLTSEGSQTLERIAEALTRHNVPPHLAESLMVSSTQFASEDPLVTLGAACDAHFSYAPMALNTQRQSQPSRPLILVGPPGAGKTLAIAKLATQAAMSNRKVCVMTADVERAGGIEQLAAFTRLLKLSLIEVEDSHTLFDAIAMRRNETIYIDTPGRNIFDPREREQTRDLIAAANGEALLTLPAGLEPCDALDMAEEYRAIGVRGLLLTRLDLARRIGSLLRIASESQLPLAGYSASNKVTEPPQPVNPVVLARMILSSHIESTEFQPSANEPLRKAATFMSR